MRSATVVLVELLRGEGVGESMADAFPFIAGYLKDGGVASRWICFSSDAYPPSKDPWTVDLRPPAREELLAHIRESGASHVLFSEAPGPGLLQFLSSNAPSVSVRHRDTANAVAVFERRWLADWLGAPGERGGFLPDLTTPVYRCQPAGRPPAGRHPTPLVGAARCLYAAPLSRNPRYRGVDLSGIKRQFACSFCSGSPDLKPPFRTPALELAIRQIKAVSAETRTLWSQDKFIVQSSSLFFAMSKLLRRLETEGLPPVSLYFSCRADEVLARADDIEKALDIARRRGHTVDIFSIGAENFSPAENERFNKGLTLPVIRKALERMRRWERDYPRNFFFTRHGGLGFILFTPWTKLEDLRLNVKAARELGLVEDSFLLTRRLMLLSDTPLLRLAQRDGLVSPTEPEALALFAWLQKHCDPGCRHFPQEQDPPWKFRDPLAARVCAVAVRMAKPGKIVADDPYHATIAAGLRDSGLRLLDAFSLLLDVAEARPEHDSVDGLVDAFLARIGRPQDTAKRYHLVSGKVECSESAHMAACLERFFAEEGCARAASMAEADVVVLNGCERITETPRLLREYRNFARRNPGKQVLVVGCVPDKGKPAANGNFHVLPSWRLARDPALIGPAMGFSKTPSWPSKDAVFGGRLPDERIPGDPPPSEVCILTIGSGCRSRCAYCSIKTGRGPCQSHDPETILAEAAAAVKRGKFRFVLLADDAGAWGHDLKLGLPHLLGRLSALTPRARFLVRPMNPVSLPRMYDGLRPFLGATDYIYLPLQAGNDRVLRLMKRGYKAGTIIELLRRIRKDHPALYLETDIIVGFPTETREEFLDSVRAARTFHHAAFHRFVPYPDTPAAALAGQVPAGEISVRMAVVRRLAGRFGFSTVDPQSFCYEPARS